LEAAREQLYFTRVLPVQLEDYSYGDEDTILKNDKIARMNVHQLLYNSSMVESHKDIEKN
jgi:hypothetical protein